MRKSDPGKKFMAFIRYIIGIYALYAKDEVFFRLVFGNFLNYDQDPWTAVRQYFRSVEIILCS
jgi:hypothetical protein